MPKRRGLSSNKPTPGGGEKGIIVDNKPAEFKGTEAKGPVSWDPGEKPAEFMPSTQGAAPGPGSAPGSEKMGIIVVGGKPFMPLPEGTNLGPGDMEAKGIIIINSKPFMPAPQGAAPGAAEAKGPVSWDPGEKPAEFQPPPDDQKPGAVAK